MNTFSSEALIGLWEQVGTLDPTSGVYVHWPAGSVNASKREFFRFFEGGFFTFGQFPAGARVSFDESIGEFVCDGDTCKIAHGLWKLEGNILTQVIAHQVWTVELSRLDEESFVINEPIPNVADVLKVAYKRVH